MSHLAAPALPHTYQVALYPAPSITVNLLVLALRSGPHPHPTPAQLFCSGPVWRLPWGGKFLPNSHHIPHLETWNDKAACFGPRNHLRQFPRSPVTGQFLRAPGCWSSESVKGRVLDPVPESVAGPSERLWPRADPRTRHAKHDQDSCLTALLFIFLCCLKGDIY